MFEGLETYLSQSANKTTIRKQDKSGIAVIGMSVRMPGADSVEEFWEELKNGKDCMGILPKHRQKDALDFCRSRKYGPKTTKFEEGGFLNQIDQFDYEFFALSPNEARYMSPAQRLFLETTWEAIEDAGYAGKRIDGSNTGVFIGYSGPDDYRELIEAKDADALALYTTGSLPPVIASRIAYLLNLRGANMVINTLCSSSIVALHTACQYIRSGECEMAVAGGVQCYIQPTRSFELEVVSEDRTTRAFDDFANGFGGGEAIVSLLLKPLSKALEDKDHIHAVILGSAVNQDGASNGMTAPNPSAQAEVIERAWRNANINPECIEYVEAHGTGTRLGDPAEIQGLNMAFQKYTSRRQFCAVGSVKTNIGHTDACSGLAGLVKAILSLKHQCILPSLHFQKPNSIIPFTESAVYVNDRLRKWDCRDKRTCGVSSFGFSGTNCHVVLQEAPAQKKEESEQAKIFCLSAKSESALLRLVKKYAAYDYQDCTLEEVCYTLATGREHFACRIALIAENIADLKQKLMRIQQCGIEKKLLGGENCDAKLYNIGKEYLQGKDIDWNTAYKEYDIQKVSLPPYSFEPLRCWIEGNGDSQEGAERYYEYKWIEQEKNEQKKITLKEGSTILVIQEDRGIGEEICNLYKNDGYHVVQVFLGKAYVKDAADRYIVGPSQQDYMALMDEIFYQNITQIIHIGAVEGKAHKENGLSTDELCQKGIYSMFYLLKAIKEYKLENLQMVVVTSGVNAIEGECVSDNSLPAAMYGLAKVVNVEEYKIKVRAIDIEPDIEAAFLYQEFTTESDFFLTAYRNGKRYVEELALLDQVKPESYVEIKEQGVYVIAGGTGAIGLEFAQYLSQSALCNIILLCRTMPQDEKLIKHIQNISKYAQGLEVLNVDITKEEDVRKGIGYITEKYDKIHGIINCAAVGVGCVGTPIRELDFSIFRKVLMPKVHGTRLLYQYTADKNLDFFVCLSSAITLTGGEGSAGYAAGNYFMESFAAACGNKGGKTVSISYPTWLRSVSVSERHFDESTQVFEPVATEEILEAFHTAICYPGHKIFPGRLNKKGEIFGLGQLLPFRLSDAIWKNIQPLEEEAEQKQVIEKKYEVKIDAGEEFLSSLETEIVEVFAEVLGYRNIRVSDNFFQMGGDSIVAMKIINLLKKRLQVEISLAELVNSENLLCFVRQVSREKTAKRQEIITQGEKKEYYETSLEQRRFYLLSQKENIDCTYNMPEVLLLSGTVNPEYLEGIFKKMIQRHESLRTSFEMRKGSCVQIVHDTITFSMEIENSEQDKLEEEIERFIRPFDLTKAPLFRAKLIVFEQEQSALLIDLHHIISDGTSKSIFMRDFMDLYNGKELSPLEVQYKDYVQWCKKNVNDEKYQEQRKYWHYICSGEIPVLDLPTDYKRPEISSFSGSVIYYTIDSECTDMLKEFAKEKNVTLNMVLLCGYFILLNKLTGQNDIIVGTVAAGRRIKEVENVIGDFLNFMAIRCIVEEDYQVQEFLEEIKSHVLSAYENQEYPIEQVIDELNIQCEKNRSSLYDTMFITQNIKMPDYELNGLKVSPYHLNNKYAKLDLSIDAEETCQGIQLRVEYKEDLFRKKTIEDTYMKKYCEILKQMTKYPGRLISELMIEVSTDETSVLDELEFDF